MSSATPCVSEDGNARVVSLKVAIVGSDDPSRLALVKALEAAPADWSLRLHDTPPPDADVVVADRDSEVPGAIVWEEGSDLVARVAELSEASCRSILVTSPSGGTGVTSIALHLAAELAARGHSTAYVETDPAFGGRARLGVETDPTTSLPVPVAGGFRLVAAGTGLDGFDRAVIDTRVDLLSTPSAGDRAVLVCAPTPTGVRRAALLLEQRADMSWSVVANRLGPGGETTRTQMGRDLGRPVLELPCCAALRDAEDEGRLLARGWSRWTRGISRLAAQIDA